MVVHSLRLTSCCDLQDPESISGAPNFILKLSNDDELMFTFTFHIRQTSPLSSSPNSPLVDTQINGLTHVHAPTLREVETLVTREFHANPNLHKNPNVELIGDFTSGGSPTVTFDWSWKWKPPRTGEDPGGGWRNTCSVRCLVTTIVVLLRLANKSAVRTI